MVQLAQELVASEAVAAQAGAAEKKALQAEAAVEVVTTAAKDLGALLALETANTECCNV